MNLNSIKNIFFIEKKIIITFDLYNYIMNPFTFQFISMCSFEYAGYNIIFKIKSKIWYIYIFKNNK